MKFSLTKTTKTVFGTKLFQIKAECNFGNVKKGELGGWVEKEENLSQEGNAWVCGNARVYGNAWVCGNARVYGNARVCGNAWVCGDARVYGNARVCGDARVYGDARVCGKISVSLGYFFGIRKSGENLTFKDTQYGFELIGKGECKFDEPEVSVSGKKVKVTIDGREYSATID